MANEKSRCWRNAKGIEISDADIIDTLSPFRSSEDQSSFFYESKKIPVQMALSWKKSFSVLDSHFARWCNNNAIVCDTSELNAYFGESSEMMDFPHHCLIWEPYFESKCICFGEEELDLGSQLERQLDFEDAVGVARIGNPSLFPSRKTILSAIGGFDYPVEQLEISGVNAKHANRAVRGKHAADSTYIAASDPKPVDELLIAETLSLSSEWEHDDETKGIIADLCEEVTKRFCQGNYDPEEVFIWFCDKVEAWVYTQHGLTQTYRDNEDLTRRVARRLAAMKFIGNEALLVRAVGEVVSNPVRVPPRLTEDRLTRLRAGSAWKPN